jgi:probable HAF family extracellular repeat protein
VCVGIFGLNARNQLLGNQCNGGHAFVWTDGNIAELTVPGAVETSARGFNDKGQVAGSYDDGTTRHGFFWNGTTFITLDPPGSISTEATDVNNKGHVVGYYTDESQITHNFLWTGKKFIIIDAPEGFIITERPAINNRDHVLTHYIDDGSQFQPFIWAKGRVVEVFEFLRVMAFNDRDQVLFFSERDIQIWTNGKFKTFEPDPNASFIQAEDINARGQIVGQVESEGFVFNLRRGTFTTFSQPGATETSPQLINANGVIFGESDLGFFLAFP